MEEISENNQNVLNTYHVPGLRRELCVHYSVGCTQLPYNKETAIPELQIKKLGSRKQSYHP